MTTTAAMTSVPEKEQYLSDSANTSVPEEKQYLADPANESVPDEWTEHEHVLAWANVQPVFDSTSPSWGNLISNPFDWTLYETTTGIITPPEEIINSTPPPPFYLQHNHYQTEKSLELIEKHIQNFCREFKLSFEFTNVGYHTYTYKCVYIRRCEITEVWFSIFSSDSGFIIELNCYYGCGFAFVDVVRAFRYSLEINEFITNPNEEPYKELEEMKLDSMLIEPDRVVVQDCVNTMIVSASSPFTDIAAAAIIALADMSSKPSVIKEIVSNIDKLPFTLLHSEERSVCYCILVIIKNILVEDPEQKSKFVKLIPDVISRMRSHTLPQIWEKCTEVLMLIGEPIDPENFIAIIELLRSNPFPTLAPLAQIFEESQKK